MSFKTILGTASAMAVLLSAPAISAHETDHDDGPKVERSFDFTGFDKIRIEGVYEVDIRVGPNFSIETSGSEKRMALIEVEKSGDTLVLGLKDSSRGKRWKGHNKGIHAVIHMPALNEIELQGVGSVDARGIDAKSFDVSLEGVGSIELSGKCESLSASVEGIGSLDAEDLECETVDVTVEGMGSAEVYASEAVDADIDGMGSIDVKGSPESVKKSKSFMSSISVR